MTESKVYDNDEQKQKIDAHIDSEIVPQFKKAGWIEESRNYTFYDVVSFRKGEYVIHLDTTSAGYNVNHVKFFLKFFDKIEKVAVNLATRYSAPFYSDVNLALKNVLKSRSMSESGHLAYSFICDYLRSKSIRIWS